MTYQMSLMSISHRSWLHTITWQSTILKKSANIIFSQLWHTLITKIQQFLCEKKHYSAKGHLLCTSWQVSHTNLTYILGWVHIINHKQQWLFSLRIYRMMCCTWKSCHFQKCTWVPHYSLANIHYLAKMWRMQIATIINGVSFPKI